MSKTVKVGSWNGSELVTREYSNKRGLWQARDLAKAWRKLGFEVTVIR